MNSGADKTDRASQLKHLATCFGAGDLAAAEEIARQLIAETKGPQDEEALRLLAQIVFKQGRSIEAIELMKAVLEIDPMRAAYNNDYGVMLAAAGRWSEAASACGMAAVLDRNNIDAQYNLALALFRTGQTEKARTALDRLLAKRPDLPEALALDGELLCKENKRVEAAANNEEAHFYQGYAHIREGRMESAIDNFKRALEINPRVAETWLNLGCAYFSLLLLEEAEDAFRRALEIQPDNAKADLNLGILLLLRGEFSEGWMRFDARWRVTAAQRPEFIRQEWIGDPLGQRTLLVYGNQGLGDNLQFARYLPLLRQRYPEARICFLCWPPLYRLFESHAAWEGIELLPSSTNVDGLSDAQIDLMSLPRRMGTTLSSIPADVPYLVAPPEQVEKWSARLESLPGRKVGLVWASGEITSFQSRTVRLKQLGPLLGVGGISWVSLQKGDSARQIEEEGLSNSILNVMDEVEDFADTAAIIAHLDLVVSVDTSVPHLAGAMGKPVWLLNRFDTDWRWLLNREDSPWYPTMRIFRQSSFRDWDSVLPRVTQVLADWAIKVDSCS